MTRMLARLAVRRHRLVLVIGLAITIAGALLASQLTLQTDLAELLPERAPSVIALRALSKRVGGTGNVAIAIEATGPEALRAYVPRLADALRAKLGTRLLSLRYRRTEVDQYYRRFAAYYVPLDRLAAWSARADHAIATKENPLYVDLGDSDELATLASELRSERDKLSPKNAADAASGLFMAEGGTLAVIFLRPAADSLDLAASAGLLDEISAVIATTAPAAAGVHIAGYTGSIPSALSEVAAVRHDIASSAILVIIGVGGVIALYFRSLRALVLLGAPLIVGTAVALGFAKLAIGHLNAQTAFLGAIIFGTGVNYGIILLDRFRARDRAVSLEEAVATAIAATLRATSIAALATAAAFGVLAAGEVESFRQFGWIGGVGILAAWLATFTIVPAALVAISMRDAKPWRWRPLVAICSVIARACERRPRVIAAAAVMFALAGAGLAWQARDHALETDLRELETRSRDISGIERLDNRLRAMDDRSSTPAVLAIDRREDARPICDQLDRRAQSDLRGIVTHCYCLDDLFPADLARRTPLIAHLRATLDRIDADDLAPADRADIAELSRALAERAPVDHDLPPPLAEYFVERDGSWGKLLYVDPVDEHFEANLYKLTDALRTIHLPSGATVESSGELVVFADVLRAVRRDASTLTLAAAILVFLVLALALRKLGPIVRVGGALVAGIAVMLGLAVLAGQKLNFFNFVALPTTFGVGIDYAINIEERIRLRGDVVRAVTEAGPPVILASLTSMIGYASLVVADSRALASFGELAILGELACVVLALTLVPSAWFMRITHD